ncbi:hypothetical protein [Clostridium oceanicum]|uniref:Restriction endonuclease type IV Mrr domain-containing protein n=1 Tax=Clostridium oceanicum TaxID=1543 RepID=A0ABN1JA22_9CLOT
MKKAKWTLKKVKVDEILNSIENSCWKYGIQYDILYKNSESVLLRLRRKKKIKILKYHKSQIVFEKDFKDFLNYMDKFEIDNGVYITTGVFTQEILNKVIHFKFKNIKLVDNLSLIKKELGLKGKSNDMFKKPESVFLAYLP